MYVHRSVGKLTFVTCDVVLGSEGATGKLEEVLRDATPETIAVDLSVDDLVSVPKGEFKDPYLSALAGALSAGAVEDLTLPYHKTITWAARNNAEIRPIAPRSRVGMMTGRRIQRALERIDAKKPETAARRTYSSLVRDKRVGPLIERRKTDLTESLTNILRGEPPRMMAVFSFPWGETVSSEVRRALGLRRIEGHTFEGAWPE